MSDLIIGCGYLGKRVAARWLAENRDVHVLTRSQNNADQFTQQGMTPVIGDVTQPESLNTLAQQEYGTVLYAVGFDRAAGPSKREVYIDGLQNVLARLKPRCQRFLYISSTSVYGVSDGSWVDEQSATEPETESGEICLQAEQAVRNTFSTGPATGSILRLAGIYGPDRLLRRIEMLRNDDPIPGNPESWLNLIHVEDAARVALAVEKQRNPASLYLVCDNQPPTREEYYRELARLVNAPEPRFDDDTPAKRTRGLNKRCRNQFVKESLPFQFDYPTYQTGLQTAVEQTDGLD
ncbi:short chain dehydrogenase [Polystyrenella longa]|uniref:Short chain dehydrogenase n=1 Tax=Polystyrenella longa TaxID=2528007 RepID=A0A518CGI4_9PLAN|nr:SDR family oxidoreductase [Polystyrenella longa]QDU78335.1 short chain dehydrogenase [Polystyrenella longa]